MRPDITNSSLCNCLVRFWRLALCGVPLRDELWSIQVERAAGGRSRMEDSSATSITTHLGMRASRFHGGPLPALGFMMPAQFGHYMANGLSHYFCYSWRPGWSCCRRLLTGRLGLAFERAHLCPQLQDIDKGDMGRGRVQKSVQLASRTLFDALATQVTASSRSQAAWREPPG